jgi:hypothetical protein
MGGWISRYATSELGAVRPLSARVVVDAARGDSSLYERVCVRANGTFAC